MRKKKSKSTPVSKLFSDVKQPVSELIVKMGVTYNMSQLRMVQAVRAFIEGHPNEIRICNAILFKLGINVQVKDSPRKARVYAMTAVDEALKQGTNFNPDVVQTIAETRLIKINNILGRETLVEQEDEVQRPSKVTKKSQAIEYFLSNKDKSRDDIIKGLMKVIDGDKLQATSYYYQAKRSMSI